MVARPRCEHKDRDRRSGPRSKVSPCRRAIRTSGTARSSTELSTLRTGFEERAHDISAVWTWLGHHDLTTPAAAELFRDVRLHTYEVVRELTMGQLWALFETTST
jgi:hypothetical protein